MKKLTVLLCILSLLTAAALPSLAEQNGGKQPPQMGQGAAPGGDHGGPGGPGGQKPPEKTDGQNPPEKPEGDSGEGQQPGGDPLQKLVEAGTLSQTTYDAIREYMKNNGSEQTPPEKPDGDAEKQTPPEKPEGSSDQTPPEKPDGSNPPAGQPGGTMLTQEMLQTLLDAGVITEDEYSTLLASVTAASSETTADSTTESSD